MRFLLVLLLAACDLGSNEAPTPPPPPVTQAPAAPAPAAPAPAFGAPAVTGPAAPAPAAPAADFMAELPPLGAPSAVAPTTAPYVEGPGLRLVIFSASWCPACRGATLEIAAIARRNAGRVVVGVAVASDDDATFTSSPYARWFAGVPIWSSATTAAVSQRCAANALPTACLVDGDRVIWRGGPSDAPPVIDAYLANALPAMLARRAAADAFVEAAQRGDTAARQQALEALRGFADHENNLAWGLVDRDVVPPADLPLAIALAEDATRTTGGMNANILDTLAVAYFKAARHADAARVSARTIAVCDALSDPCAEVRPRAQQYLAATR